LSSFPSACGGPSVLPSFPTRRSSDLDLLQIDAAMSFTVEYQQSTPNDVLDYRMSIHPKNSYQNNDILRPCIYPQVFGSNFAENLSIIDLLFCEGPNARHILNQSTFQ